MVHLWYSTHFHVLATALAKSPNGNLEEQLRSHCRGRLVAHLFTIVVLRVSLSSGSGRLETMRHLHAFNLERTYAIVLHGLGRPGDPMLIEILRVYAHHGILVDLPFDSLSLPEDMVMQLESLSELTDDPANPLGSIMDTTLAMYAELPDVVAYQQVLANVARLMCMGVGAAYGPAVRRDLHYLSQIGGPPSVALLDHLGTPPHSSTSSNIMIGRLFWSFGSTCSMLPSTSSRCFCRRQLSKRLSFLCERTRERINMRKAHFAWRIWNSLELHCGMLVRLKWMQGWNRHLLTWLDICPSPRDVQLLKYCSAWLLPTLR